MIITKTLSFVDYGRQSPSRPPIYLNQLRDYPPDNPIFVTVDRSSFNFIHRLKGICLLCDETPDNYDVTFGYQREVWVLYSQENVFLRAMSLAHALQRAGTNKILVILISIQPPRRK